MSFEARLNNVEEKLKYLGINQNHSHVGKAHQIKDRLYNDDGTEFVDDHPKECPQMFIVITRGEESNEMPV